MAKNTSDIIIQDGIAAWFAGPEWDDVAEDAFRSGAENIKSEAQYNAPWADRTGDARAGIDVSVENQGGVIVLSLFHTVEYGLWLEVIQNGAFAIIMPTLEASAPQMFANASQQVMEARQGVDY